MTGFTGEVHPLADALPMLDADALADMAADIKENGQADPIVLDGEGRLVDGRNRLAACEKAGVEPRFVVVSDQDPVSVIVSRNGQRRNLSAGQRAMLIAHGMWHQDKWDHGARRWKYGSVKGNDADASIDRRDLMMCGAVLAHSRDLARQVLAGTVALRTAYDTVKTAERKAEEDAAQMETLRVDAPDLHNHVTEGTLPLAEAFAAYQKRTEKERKAREDAIAWRRKLRDGLRDAVTEARTGIHPGNLADLIAGVIDNPDERCTPEQVREAAANLNAIADALEQENR